MSIYVSPLIIQGQKCRSAYVLFDDGVMSWAAHGMAKAVSLDHGLLERKGGCARTMVVKVGRLQPETSLIPVKYEHGLEETRRRPLFALVSSAS